MLDLENRTGLPDALRVLVERHPREGWERHPRFNALTRFWLNRHLMFRRLNARLIEGTEAFLDARTEARVWGDRMARLAGGFLNELHGHHLIEDHQYFPLLERQDGRLERGFQLLDADHQALDPLLQGLADRANAVLDRIAAGADARDAAGALHGELTRFARFLDRHLTDEEDLVVPVILEYDPPELRP